MKKVNNFKNEVVTMQVGKLIMDGYYIMMISYALEYNKKKGFLFTYQLAHWCMLVFLATI